MKQIDIPYGEKDMVTYVGRDGYGFLKPGDIVQVIKIEPGIFDGDFYTTAIDSSGHRTAGFSWRFKPLQLQPNKGDDA